jgi:Protein of unknown function (DUF2933)
MEWLPYLLLLLCPIMMIFCIKGMGHGHKNHSHGTNDLNMKISKLEGENERLQKEIDFLSAMVKKESENSKGPLLII